MSGNLAPKVSVLFLLIFVVGLVGQSLSLYLYVYPQSTLRSEPFVLKDFGVTPHNECCFYIDQTKTILAPGDNLTGQVQVFYQSELPSDNSLPYFFLVSAGQFTRDNAQTAFADRVYRSSPANVTKDFQQREVTISYLIKDIRESGAHYFVLVPQAESSRVVPQTMIVSGNVWRLVPDRSLGIAAQVLSLASFATLGIIRLRLRKGE